MGEPLTDARIRIYAEDLSNLSRPQLEIAFKRARLELKFFPKISELCELAGAKEQDARTVEGEAAWKFLNDYLGKWGVDLMPFYSAGKRIDPPALPSKIQYALRRIGGLSGLNQVTAESRPFMLRDFLEAYQRAPIAESLAPQMENMFGSKKLLGQLKQLSSFTGSHRKSEDHRLPLRIKRVPEPLTDAQIRDRREMLRQQAEFLRSKTMSAAAGV